ncbi:outer membrane beta-barrel protein [Lutibaculum baratangense]|uniref:Outer membrane protein/protective antigen OMA87 n=1 Tax=Lutibaculum baratangense AMV1 TaxID=631454 RepID=V4RLX3_9HYPH|nr:outer membrane beta-barrel protein [Lutibaculum baratangense]ESR24245.1 Outer membrane protein/protective antigen OMA87 [Lutibaculum baratangense AMV1]
MSPRHKILVTFAAAALLPFAAPGQAMAQALRGPLLPQVGLETLRGGLAASAAAEEGVAATTTATTPAGSAPSQDEADEAPQPAPADDDPYAPLGIRLGSFLLYPSLTIVGGHSSNIDLAEDPVSGSFYSLRPELELRSDWSRHELAARLAADTEFDDDGDTTTSLDSELALRLDLVRSLVADLRATYNLAPEALSDPDLPADAVERPDVETYGVSASLSDTFGRVGLTGSLSYEAHRYEDARLSDGSLFDNSDRNYDETGARLRASYDVGASVGVFVEGGVNERDYEREVDDNGIRRGSSGYEVLAGLTLARGEVLEGELGIGYQRQTPVDDSLEDVEGLLYRGSLAWRPTALTTLRLQGELRPEETVLEPGASGIRTATLGLSVEHALRRNLLVVATLGAERADYVGVPRLEKSYTAALEVDYAMNRFMSWRAGVGHTRRDSNVDGSDYEETRVEAGVTLRR